MDIVLWLLFGFIVVVGFAVVCMIFYGIFQFMDYAFTPVLQTTGHVTSISFQPSRYESYYDAALKIPTVRMVPANWSVYCETDQGSGSINLGAAPCFPQGSKVTVKYSKGRITGMFKIRQLQRS